MARDLGVQVSVLQSVRAFALVGLAFGSGLFLGLATVTSAAAKGRDPYAGLDTFARALATIEQNYVELVDTRMLVNAAIRGLVTDLDSHSVYLDPDAYQDLRTSTDGEIIGVGLFLVLKPVLGPTGEETPVVVVSRVIAGSPGELAGVKSGDVVVAIDGAPVPDLETATARLDGERGTPVVLDLRRADQTIRVSAVRDRVIDSGVQVEALEGGVAYVRVEHFRRNVAAEVDRRLSELPSSTGIILDVRDNPGGLLEEAVQLVDLFVADGEIVSTRGRDGRLVERHDAKPSDGDRAAPPLVVLVNESSASASEIVAGALQLLGRATVVGTKSYGKGSVQQVFEFEDASALKLTVARYALTGNVEIDGVGVVPDRVVPFVHEASSARLRTEIEALALEAGTKTRLLAEVEALESDLPVAGGAMIPWTGSFLERRKADPQLEAAWNQVRAAR